MFLPVGCAPELCVPDGNQINTGLSLYLCQLWAEGVFIQYLSEVTDPLLQSEFRSLVFLQLLSVRSGLQNKTPPHLDSRFLLSTYLCPPRY